MRLVGERDGIEWLHSMFLECNGSSNCLVGGTEPFRFVFGSKDGAIISLVWLENKNENMFRVTHTIRKLHIRPRPLVPVTALAGTNVQI